MKKVDTINYKYGYIIAAAGIIATVISFFVSDSSSRNILFIFGAILLIVGVAMILSIKPVKKL